MDNNLPSKLVENAVNELGKLPGVGEKTALRLALHLLNEDPEVSSALGNAIIDMRENIQYCKKCHNISDSEVCHICANPARDNQTVCVVHDVRDVMAIENTAQFNGLYHVLGNIISPMEGIGPDKLTIDALIKRLQEENVRELILALPSTVEGDTTAYYIVKQIRDMNIKVSNIARGIGVGDELEYADEATLGRSIKNRVPYDDEGKDE